MYVSPRRAPLVLALLIASATVAGSALAQVQSVTSQNRARSTAYAPPSPSPAADNRRPLDYSPRSTAEERSAVGGRPAPYYPPAPIWTGLYGGIHAGYGWGSVNARDIDLGRARTSGAIAGVHAGYNWQQDNLVFGVEGDFSSSWIDGTRSFASGLDMDAKNDWNSSLRLRLGYAFSNVLVYATGGVAFGKLEATVRDPALIGSQNAWHTGYVVGGGMEIKLTQMTSLRGEVLHYGYGSKDYSIGGVSVPVRGDETIARMGLTFHMN